MRAKTTLDASRRAARNGERVRFSGKLVGKPVPRRGKLVQLQAFYRARWRTFAVVRTNRKGAWSHQYRFGATRGVVTYPFRAVVPREADYPYQLGYSRTVRIRVAGR